MSSKPRCNLGILITPRNIIAVAQSFDGQMFYKVGFSYDKYTEYLHWLTVICSDLSTWHVVNVFEEKATGEVTHFRYDNDLQIMMATNLDQERNSVSKIFNKIPGLL